MSGTISRSTSGLATLEIGRQAYEDAEFNLHASTKMNLLLAASAQGDKYDIYFAALIILNLIVIGIEIDHGKTPESKLIFIYIEIVFLVAFTFELSYRLNVQKLCCWCWRRKTTPIEPLGSIQRTLDVVGDDPTTEENFCEEERMRRRSVIVRLDEIRRLTEEGYWFLASWLQFVMIISADITQHYSWILFDFAIIALSVVDLIMTLLSDDEESGGSNFTFLRILRLLRVVRSVKLFRYFKVLWLLIHSVWGAIKALGWVAMLMLVMNYAFAIYMTMMITTYPDTYNVGKCLENFNTVPRSMFTLFTIMTLEGWPDIVNDLIDVHNGYGVMFVLYVLLTHFLMVNLLIGVILDQIQNMATTTDLQLMKEVRDRQREIYQKLHRIFEKADANGDNSLSVAELKEILRTDEDCKITLEQLNMMPSEIDWLFETLDADGSGNLSIDEFVQGVLKCKESELARQLMQMQYTLIREVRLMTKTIVGDNYKMAINPMTGSYNFANDTSSIDKREIHSSENGLLEAVKKMQSDTQAELKTGFTAVWNEITELKHQNSLSAKAQNES